VKQWLAITSALVAAVAAAPVARQGPPAPAAPAQAQPAKTQEPRAPSFRSDIDVVQLNVTVTDSGGRYLSDVKEEEFLVFESGVRQSLTFFSRGTRPIALSLLLDSSASMEFKLPTLQAAATSFVQRLKPQDIAQVIDFDERPIVRRQFTSSHAELVRGINEATVGGPTFLYNAVYIALKELKKVQSTSTDEPRRQALIVFTDGNDTGSIVSYEEVLDTAKRSETAIYTIGLRDENNNRGFQNSEFFMRQIALETGGRSFFPKSINDLTNVYAQIADELSSQYSLGYSSTNLKRDGAWRPIVVRLSRPNVVTRTKQGYFGPR
jgi:Ca-activated chloride channel family protein